MNDNSDRKISQADVLRIIDQRTARSMLRTAKSGNDKYIPINEYEAMVKEIEEL